MPERISFGDAIARATEAGGKRHVLLGNGFSIGAHDKFAYGTLYEQARAAGLPEHIVALFDRYGTTNFEEVLRQLDEGRWLAEYYRLQPTDDQRDMATDYEALKSALVEAVASTHPAIPNEVGEARLAASAGFLTAFANVYTTNYDLLLYWASLVKDPFPFKDGFGREEDTPDEHVVFLQATTSDEFIYFLHGALHLTTVDGEVRKFVWNTTGVPLIEQVRGALEQKLYPLVVSEGRALDKRVRIESSSYLSWAFRRFENLTGNLFTYGWALSEQDEHLLEAIVRNTSLKSVYVAVYGDPEEEPNRNLMAAARDLVARRTTLLEGGRRGGRLGRATLEVHFYDAASANVWGPS